MIAVIIGFFAVALAGLVALHGPERAGAAPDPSRAPRLELPRFALAVGVLVATFGAQVALIAHTARTQAPFPPWFAALPLLPIDDRGPLFGHAPGWNAAAACAIVETLALLAAYRVGRGRRFGRSGGAVVTLAAAAMLFEALLTPALTSFDLYAYLGSAHVPDAYRPPQSGFAGEFGLINQIYGTPIFPSPYGPVWLALAHVVTAPFATLGAQLVALRVLGGASLVASALALRALRFGTAEVALVALNPGLLADFVLDGHNDGTALALALWALALGTRLPAAAIALGALAGCVKLPFLAIGALATARAKRPALRLIGAASAVAGGAALSAVLGGRQYLAAVRATSKIYSPALADPVVNVAHLALGLVALAAVALAVTGRRSWPTASWAFVALAAAFFGWYVAWGLPYAAYERRWLPVFTLSLPLLTLLMATYYAESAPLDFANIAAIVAGPLAAYLTLRRAGRRPQAAGND